MTANEADRFSVAAAEHALQVACYIRVHHTNAKLINLGENALFRLSSRPVVVRIARTMNYWGDEAGRVCIACRWNRGASTRSRCLAILVSVCVVSGGSWWCPCWHDPRLPAEGEFDDELGYWRRSSSSWVASSRPVRVVQQRT